MPSAEVSAMPAYSITPPSKVLAEVTSLPFSGVSVVVVVVVAGYVDAPDKSSGKRGQKVHIEYDLVGYIPVDELQKAEQA